MDGADRRMSRRAALQPGEHAREGTPDPVRQPLVHLVRVDAADVVCLEDRLVDHGRGA
jgi:hypothetical protein